MKTKLLFGFLLFTTIIFLTNCSATDDIICAGTGQVPDGNGGCHYEETSEKLEQRLKNENEYIAEKDDNITSKDEN